MNESRRNGNGSRKIRDVPGYGAWLLLVLGGPLLFVAAPWLYPVAGPVRKVLLVAALVAWLAWLWAQDWSRPHGP